MDHTPLVLGRRRPPGVALTCSGPVGGTVARRRSPRPLVDGLLAAAVLLAGVGALVATGAAPAPGAAGLGVVATVVAEVLAGRFADRVRAAWASPVVRGLAVAAALVGGTVGFLLVGGAALWFGAGALSGYLALLALVQWGVVAPPERWTRRGP